MPECKFFLLFGVKDRPVPFFHLDIFQHFHPPQMQGMQYLGPSYDSVAMAYRLKFIKNGKVTFVDVDARTGRVMSRSQ